MITKELGEKVLNAALSTGGDFAELFEDKKFHSNYTMINGVVETANSGKEYGVGIRVYRNFQSVYAYTNDNSEQGLIDCATKLAKGIEGDTIISCAALQEVHYEDKHKVEKRPSEYDAAYKIAIMKDANDTALAYDAVIQKVIVSYREEEQQVLICNSKGLYIMDDRVRVRIGIEAIARDGELMATGSKRPGGHIGLELFDNNAIQAAATEAARIAKTMLYADECPSGDMPVIIDNGFGGVIFHEACGHSLEATGVAKGASVFAGKKGKQIASELVTAVDDATIPNAWGSNNIDDEGNFTKRNVLIQNGILTSYLVDQLNGRRMNEESTGSGRRESYQYEPTSRMSNTFLENGTSTFEEIIANTKLGLYAKNLGGGSVDPSTGDYNFAVLEAYIVKDGKITKPVKGATLVGNGSNTLMKIDMVANNLSREQGMCGSISGSIPTDVGQPTIRVSSMTVGGKGGRIDA